MLPLYLERRQAIQDAVRPGGVEVNAPGSDDDLGLGARAEPLAAPSFVASSQTLASKLSLAFCQKPMRYIRQYIGEAPAWAKGTPCTSRALPTRRSLA
jgi:hypothetical protein